MMLSLKSRRGNAAIALAAAGAAVLTAGLIAAPAAQASDTVPWTGDSAKGANQPYQHGYTSNDLLRWTPASDLFGDMLRARVPLQDRVAPLAATQQHPGLSADTQLLALSGDYGNAFFESHPYTNEFSQYLFNFWQYTDFYASWHGMPTAGVPEEMYDPTLDWREKWFEFGMLNLPNPGYTNAAHKNGARSLGTIFFSDNDRGPQTYTEMLVQDADGTFPVAEKLVEMADYYGYDGYFVNQESSVAVGDIARYKKFLQALRDGGMYVQFYDSVDNATGEVSYQNEFNATNSPFVRDPELGDVSNSMFLNYWWDAGKLTRSRDHAVSLGLDPRETVFAGVEAGKYQFDQPYDLDDNLDASGQPMNSIGTLGADFVHSDFAGKVDDAQQWQTFDRERRWWTGSSTGTTAPTAAGAWKGISSYITERSPIKGSTFVTTFNTGHGLDYVDEGVVSNGAQWSNINLQDVPVTWQWDLQSHGTALGVDVDYGPDYTAADRFHYAKVGAYQGGSSLVVSGRLDSANYLRLYKTDLAITSRSQLAVTSANRSASDGAALRVAVTLTNDPGTVIELPLAAARPAGKGWTVGSADLSAYAGQSIATLGLVFAPGAKTVTDYQVNIGKIALTDGVTTAPATPTGFRIDMALPGTQELVLRWDLGAYKDVARYDVYANGKYLGGIYDDVLYVKKFQSPRGKLELRAVGHDGTSSKPARIHYDFTTAPQDVVATSNADGTVTVNWSNTAASGHVTVRLASQYRAAPIDVVKTLHGPTRTSSAVFDHLPTDGGKYVVTVQNGQGTAVAACGSFVDKVEEPYPASLVTVSGNTFAFATPTTSDWYKVYVKENGVPKMFATTYSSGDKPYIIRGRTTSAALKVTMTDPNSEVTATVEDYSGNTATTVLRLATGS